MAEDFYHLLGPEGLIGDVSIDAEFGPWESISAYESWRESKSSLASVANGKVIGVKFGSKVSRFVYDNGTWRPIKELMMFNNIVEDGTTASTRSAVSNSSNTYYNEALHQFLLYDGGKYYKSWTNSSEWNNTKVLSGLTVVEPYNDMLYLNMSKGCLCYWNGTSLVELASSGSATPVEPDDPSEPTPDTPDIEDAVPITSISISVNENWITINNIIGACYYTIDGTQPSSTNGTLYDKSALTKQYGKEAFPLASSCRVRAVDIVEGKISSSLSEWVSINNNNISDDDFAFTLLTWNIGNFHDVVGGNADEGYKDHIRYSAIANSQGAEYLKKMRDFVSIPDQEQKCPTLIALQEANPYLTYDSKDYPLAPWVGHPSSVKSNVVLNAYDEGFAYGSEDTGGHNDSKGTGAKVMCAKNVESFGTKGYIDLPSVDGLAESQGRRAYYVVVKLRDREILFINTHLTTGGWNYSKTGFDKNFEALQKQSKALQDKIDNLGFGGKNKCVIVCGDFNCPWWLLADSKTNPSFENSTYNSKIVSHGWHDLGYKVVCRDLNYTDVRADGSANWKAENIIYKGLKAVYFKGLDTENKIAHDHEGIYCSFLFENSEPTTEKIAPTAISLSAGTPSNNKVQMTATFTPSDSNVDKRVTWSLSSSTTSNLSNIASIDSNGVISILSGANATAVNVTCTSSVNNAIKGETNVTLTYTQASTTPSSDYIDITDMFSSLGGNLKSNMDTGYQRLIFEAGSSMDYAFYEIPTAYLGKDVIVETTYGARRFTCLKKLPTTNNEVAEVCNEWIGTDDAKTCLPGVGTKLTVDGNVVSSDGSKATHTKTLPSTGPCYLVMTYYNSLMSTVKIDNRPTA